MRFWKRMVFGLFVFCVGLVGPVTSSFATPPIWENSLGAPIASITDSDDAATKLPMGTFTFPFYGVTHKEPETLGVSSNGLLEFNAEDTANVPSALKAEAGEPKLAALWTDFNPSNLPPDQGTVWMNSFNDDSNPDVDRLVFTWDSAFFGCENQPGCRGLVQVQLFDTGRIIFGYNGVLTSQPPAISLAAMMPVLAKGGVKPAPGFEVAPPGTDYSQTVPFDGGGLIFEEFNGTPTHFDLDQNNLIFDPNGPDSYHVTSSVPFGRIAQAGPSAPPLANGATNDGTAPKVGLSVAKASLAKVLAKGLKLQLSCNEACFSEVTVSSKSPKLKTAGSSSVEIAQAGEGAVTVKLNRSAHLALGHASKAVLKVSANTFDESGNKRTTTKTVTVKR
jgi:hypothetical protein